ncbi:c-type cytochrome [Cyclobacterium plantarum]|uniref:c-type cytochrome n=1 Tax=Cyclobacterium plantarum TaxID=2716263 RepID=UPI003F712AAC
MRLVSGKVLVLFILMAGYGCNQKEKNQDAGINEIEDLKTKQYAIQGRQLYLQYCANCHQKDGSGLARLIPPLKRADYMLTDIERTIRLIKYGIKGEIQVNGITYNQPMPGYPQLTAIEIAQISTYIYNVWGNKKGIIETERVNNALKIKSDTDIQ